MTKEEIIKEHFKKIGSRGGKVAASKLPHEVLVKRAQHMTRVRVAKQQAAKTKKP